MVFLVFCLASCLLVPMLGQDFFPSVDAGTFRLHVRVRSGTRIEETAKFIDQVEVAIRREIPADELHGILDNIGLPNSGINLSYSDSGVVGSGDADILVSLNEGHRPTPGYVRRLRLRPESRVPRRDVLLPAGRHRQPDNQLRPARAVRHPGRRTRSGQEPRGRRASGGPDPARSRRRGRAHPATRRPVQDRIRHRPHEGLRNGAHRERRSPTRCCST